MKETPGDPPELGRPSQGHDEAPSGHLPFSGLHEGKKTTSRHWPTGGAVDAKFCCIAAEVKFSR
jgi:hypothetical protein